LDLEAELVDPALTQRMRKDKLVFILFIFEKGMIGTFEFESLVRGLRVLSVERSLEVQ
jgi:hypothetical protein